MRGQLADSSWDIHTHAPARKSSTNYEHVLGTFLGMGMGVNVIVSIIISIIIIISSSSRINIIIIIIIIIMSSPGLTVWMSEGLARAELVFAWLPYSTLSAYSVK